MKTVGMYIKIPTKYIIIKILKQLNNQSLQPRKNYNKQIKTKNNIDIKFKNN